MKKGMLLLCKKFNCWIILIILIIAYIIYILTNYQKAIVFSKITPDAPETTVNTAKQPTLLPSTEGRVIFLNSTSRAHLLMITDYEGNRVQEIGAVTGSPAWSPDGRYIAVGCLNPSRLCILDANAIPDIRNYPPKFSNLPKLIKNEIELPGSCDVKSLPLWGLSSVSWSHDGKKIAIVCEQYEGNTVIDSSVCIILPDGGNGTCWDKTSKSYNHVKRISWSPMSDVLAISANGLFIVDPKGNNATLLKNNGWSPTWSPDGKQIAFFRQGEKQGDYQIVIMNSDGSNEQVLYTPPVSNDYNDTYYRIIPSCEQISGLCRLAWSPDGRYIAFSSDWTENFWVIFRIDIKTGAIIFLTVPQGGKFSEPDWSPLGP